MSTGQPVSMTVSASVHLRSGTQFVSRAVAVEDRGVLNVDGPGSSYVTVFGARTELARLRDALAALVAELDNGHAKSAHSVEPGESAA